MKPLHGVRELADGFRAVRHATIQVAEEFAEEQFAYRPTAGSRSVAETLVHIAWLASADQFMHEEVRIESVEGFDFPALIARSRAEEARERTKAEVVGLLRTEGERWVQWVESLAESFLREEVRMPGGRSVNRFAMLVGTKEHEMHHRGQLTVLKRLSTELIAAPLSA